MDDISTAGGDAKATAKDFVAQRNTAAFIS
jgi:hypothetical protein